MYSFAVVKGIPPSDLQVIVGTSRPFLISVSYTHLRAHETREDRGVRGVG